MIQCRNNKTDCECDLCIIHKDAFQTNGGDLVCDIAEDLDYDEKEIMACCNYAEEMVADR